jgi:histidinol phosphatase-like PHP family hydrolase
LRDRALGMGLKLNEYGLFRNEGNVRIAGDTEQGIYEALGLAWVAPELREARGEIDAAVDRALPRLVARSDLKGDLHMHTTETDGHDDRRAMVRAAREAGHEYIAITDHSQSLAMANGMDEKRALAHAARIRALDREEGIRVLAGVECDIRLDGTMDLADDCLAALDIVVASVHSGFNQDRQQMTDRILRAIDNPHVDVIGHPTGRKILARAPYALDLDASMGAAGKQGVALEINSPSIASISATSTPGLRASAGPDHHFHGCTLARRAQAPRVGRDGRETRMARTGRRAQHATVRGIPRPSSPEPTMTPLKMLSADDKIAEIRRLYFQTTKHTIQDDLAKALDLLKSMHSEEERERATVFMEGLAEMRKDWARASKPRACGPRRGQVSRWGGRAASAANAELTKSSLPALPPSPTCPTRPTRPTRPELLP